MTLPRWLRVRTSLETSLERQVERQAQTIHNLDRRLAEVTDVLDTIRNIVAPPWQKH